jgi:hypothetical protein
MDDLGVLRLDQPPHDIDRGVLAAGATESAAAGREAADAVRISMPATLTIVVVAVYCKAGPKISVK